MANQPDPLASLREAIATADAHQCSLDCSDGCELSPIAKVLASALAALLPLVPLLERMRDVAEDLAEHTAVGDRPDADDWDKSVQSTLDAWQAARAALAKLMEERP